ncbi:MAG TPA: hypothetical protein VIJ51_01830 [Solirubrobacteraceae bacterium]
MTRAGLAASITIVLASTAGVAEAAATKAASPSFASRADKVCAAAGAKVVALPVPTAANVVSDIRANRTIITKLVSQLKAIKAPAAKAKTYAAFIASTKEQGTILGETIAAFNAKQASKIQRLSGEATTVGRRSDAEAKSLGLPACAKDYSPSGASTTGTTTPATTAPPATTSQLTDPPPATVTPAAPAATTAAPAAASATTGTSAASAGSAASPDQSGNSSQGGTQSFNGSQSGGQSINTSGGGFFTTG